MFFLFFYKNMKQHDLFNIDKKNLHFTIISKGSLYFDQINERKRLLSETLTNLTEPKLLNGSVQGPCTVLYRREKTSCTANVKKKNIYCDGPFLKKRKFPLTNIHV